MACCQGMHRYLRHLQLSLPVQSRNPNLWFSAGVTDLLDQKKLTSSESLAPEASEASGKVVDIALNW